MLLPRCALLAAVTLTLLAAAGHVSAQQESANGSSEAAAQANPKLREGRYLSAAEVRARQEYERERGIAFPRLVRGNPLRKVLALTFDDGPHPAFTPRLLDTLRQLGVPATFFVVGKMVDRHPELAQMEAADGHEVANHTYNHLRLPTLPAALIESELVQGADAIRRALGSSTRLFRPPGGEYDADVVAVTKRLRDVMVLWTDDPADFASPGSARIEEKTLRAVSNGGILLLHDGIQETLDVLPDLVSRLKARGYRFVTCSEMARDRGVISTGGPVIRPRPAPRAPKAR